MPEYAQWYENIPGAVGAYVYLIASIVFNYLTAVRLLCLSVRQSPERQRWRLAAQSAEAAFPSAGGNDTATRGTQTRQHLKAIKQMKTVGKRKRQASGWEQPTRLVVWREVISSHFCSKRHPGLGDKIPVEIFPCHSQLLISNFNLCFNLIKLRCQTLLFLLSPNDFAVASLLETQTFYHYTKHSQALRMSQECLFLQQKDIYVPPANAKASPAQASGKETHSTSWKTPPYEGSRTNTHSHNKTTWKTDSGNVCKLCLHELNSEKSQWFILATDMSCFWFHWQSTPQAFFWFRFTG